MQICVLAGLVLHLCTVLAWMDIADRVVSSNTSTATDSLHNILTYVDALVDPDPRYTTATSRTPLCLDLLERSKPNKEDYNTVIGPWLEKKLNEWRQANPDYASQQELGFMNYLVDTYAPDVTPHQKRCDLAGSCSIPECNDYSQDFPLEEQVMVYYAMDSIFNLYQSYLAHMEANHKSFSTIQAALILDTYSDLKEFRKHQASVELNQKIALSVSLTVVLAVSPFLGPVAPAALGMSVTSAEILGTVASSLSGVYAGINSLGQHDFQVRAGDAAGVSEQIEHHLMEAMQDQFNVTDAVIRGGLHNLLRGSQDYGVNTLADLVKTGDYMTKRVIDNEFQNAMHNNWFAAYLGIVWKMERVYIVMADAEGSCGSDHRGFQGIKVCLEEYPGKVFYMYFIPRVREGTPHQAYVRGPPGFKALENQSGIHITLADVVRSSVHEYYRSGNNPATGPVTPSETESYVKHFGNGHAGGRFAGYFQIPVCNSPHGNAISSVNRNKGRNYPCMCGPNPWKNKKSWTQEADESRNFLVATTLFQSSDFEKRCDKKCHKAHKKNYDFPEGATKGLKHPYDKCKFKKHKHVGCEKGDANGHDSLHTDC